MKNLNQNLNRKSNQKIDVMAKFAVLHLEKGAGNDAPISSHIERTVNPSNADKDRTHLNRELIQFPEGVKNRTEAIQYRIEHAEIARKISHNQVRAIRVMMTGSPEQMQHIQDEGKLDNWCRDSLDWLRKEVGSSYVCNWLAYLCLILYISINLNTIIMSKNKNVNFEGQAIYIGLDVHLNSWSVTIATDYVIGRTFSISNTSTVLKSTKGCDTFGMMLLKYLQTNYPKGDYYSAYEAGFCGFSIHYELTRLGMTNIVVNPADIPTSQKQEVQKSDRIDSLKIVSALRAGQLYSIYIPDISTLNDRMLLRVRTGIVNEIKRYKNQVKSMLNFYGIKYKQEFDGNNYNFPRKFISWIRGLDLTEATGMAAKSMLLDKIVSHREKLLTITRNIKELSQNDKYRSNFNNLITIPGISLITSMSILTEIEDINRFSSSKKFIGYLGLHPTYRSSGETFQNGEITFRHNKYLRMLLVESSHIAVQKDPAMMQEFIRYRKEGKEYNVAIIKIARKLACRIYYMLRDNRKYETGVVK
jgi:transposase